MTPPTTAELRAMCERLITQVEIYGGPPDKLADDIEAIARCCRSILEADGSDVEEIAARHSVSAPYTVGLFGDKLTEPKRSYNKCREDRATLLAIVRSRRGIV